MTIRLRLRLTAHRRGGHPGGRRRSAASVATAALLFGTAGVVRTLGPDELPFVTVAAWRTIIGAAALVALSAARGQAIWDFPVRLRPLLVAAPSILGYQLAFFGAVDRLGVAPATIVTIGTGPLVAGAIDRLISGHRFRVRWLVGVMVAAAGVIMLSGMDGVRSAPTGWLLAVLAGCSFPIYGAAAQSLLRDRPPLPAMATVFAAGTFPALVLATTDLPTRLDPGAVATVAYLGLFATALAYALWSIGLSGLTLRDTVAITLLEPVGATVLAVALLGETLTATELIGMVTVVVGVAVATFGGRMPAGPDDSCPDDYPRGAVRGPRWLA